MGNAKGLYGQGVGQTFANLDKTEPEEPHYDTE